VRKICMPLQMLVFFDGGVPKVWRSVAVGQLCNQVMKMQLQTRMRTNFFKRRVELFLCFTVQKLVPQHSCSVNLDCRVRIVCKSMQQNWCSVKRRHLPHGVHSSLANIKTGVGIRNRSKSTQGSRATGVAQCVKHIYCHQRLTRA